MSRPTWTLTNPECSVPPEQTLCDLDYEIPSVTIVYEGPTQTQYSVRYVTYNTWNTVWVG